jgi:hypothetical protein
MFHSQVASANALDEDPNWTQHWTRKTFITMMYSIVSPAFVHTSRKIELFHEKVTNTPDLHMRFKRVKPW